MEIDFLVQLGIAEGMTEEDAVNAARETLLLEAVAEGEDMDIDNYL